VVIQDRALLRRLSGRAKATWPPESASIIERHVAAHVPPPEHFAGLTPDFNVFFDAGTLIVICCRQVGRFAIADCWLAAENLMLAAAGTGLGTCCIGSTVDVLNAPNIKQELGIPHDVDVVAPIVVGFPAEELPAAERKPPVILSWRQG
jgi:nitroreductase